nr:MAG TPA: hypothetical protein [Caudoviricetes sp.]
MVTFLVASTVFRWATEETFLMHYCNIITVNKLHIFSVPRLPYRLPYRIPLFQGNFFLSPRAYFTFL